MIKSSIGRKIAMALSALFLLIFLLQHLVINLLSVISPEAFNEASHFMGTNPLIQFLMQPILMFGVLFHLITGFILEAKNRSARPVKYAYNKPGENSTWMSRNMLITGVMILLFVVVHLNDFWVHEVGVKFCQGDWSGLNEAGEMRYYDELVVKFENPARTGLYVLAFVFLSLHLIHGFASAFQSMGMNHRKYTPMIEKAGKAYAILVPALFIFIAIYHYFKS